MEDDVSGHVQRLTVLERKMFERGVEASGAVGAWKEFGCGRMGVSLAVVKGRSMGRDGRAATLLREQEEPGRKRVVSPAVGEGVMMQGQF